MPIFEFLCPACNRIYSFLSLGSNPSKQPVCPRCGGTNLSRVPSAFSVSSPARSKPEKPAASGADEASAARMEHEMEEMFRRLEAGEDPETLEEELGPQLEAEMGEEGGGEGGAPTRDDGLYSL